MVVGRSSTAPVSSAAPKKKAFDRGGPVWPPRSNAADDRLGEGLGGLCPPSQKSWGLGGSTPQPKSKKVEKLFFYFSTPGFSGLGSDKRDILTLIIHFKLFGLKQSFQNMFLSDFAQRQKGYGRWLRATMMRSSCSKCSKNPYLQLDISTCNI